MFFLKKICKFFKKKKKIGRLFGIVVEFEKNKRLLEINDKGQGKAIGINITVGKKWCCIAHEKCDCWRMQDWKKKNKVQKRWRMQVWKKKTKVKSLGKCYHWNLKKSDDGKDIIKKD